MILSVPETAVPPASPASSPPAEQGAAGSENGPLEEKHFVVRSRAGARAWFLGLLGAVMVIGGGGILFDWMPIPRILELIYPQRDPPAYETRHLTWALVFLVVGAILIAWTLTRSASRRPIIRAGGDGLELSVRAPLFRPILVPWPDVQAVTAGQESDEYGTVPSLLIRVADPDLLPSQPWGARWAGDGSLAMLALEWDTSVEEVAELLSAALEVHLPSPDPPPWTEDEQPQPETPLSASDGVDGTGTRDQPSEPGDPPE